MSAAAASHAAAQLAPAVASAPAPVPIAVEVGVGPGSANLDADVIIVGGGIIGLTTAYALLRRQPSLRLLILEQRASAGAGATQAAGGMLAPTLEAEVCPPPLLPFAFDSLARTHQLVADAERDAGVAPGTARYDATGTLWVAFGQDDLAELTRVRSILQHRDLPVQMLTARQARALEPGLGPQVRAAMQVPRDHQVDPRAWVQVLVAALKNLGAQIRCGHEVVASPSSVAAPLHPSNPAVLRCRQAVLAGGAWTSAPWAQRLCPALAQLRPVKGQVVRLCGDTPLLKHVVRTPDVYLIPRQNGALLLGATAEELGFDEAPTAGAVLDLLRFAWRALPGLELLQFETCAVGLRPAAPDHLPILGPAPNAAGWWLATGHYRDGILLAAATAAHLSEALAAALDTDGPAPTPPALVPFSPNRFNAHPSHTQRKTET